MNRQSLNIYNFLQFLSRKASLAHSQIKHSHVCLVFRIYVRCELTRIFFKFISVGLRLTLVDSWTDNDSLQAKRLKILHLCLHSNTRSQNHSQHWNVGKAVNICKYQLEKRSNSLSLSLSRTHACTHRRGSFWNIFFCYCSKSALSQCDKRFNLIVCFQVLLMSSALSRLSSIIVCFQALFIRRVTKYETLGLLAKKLRTFLTSSALIFFQALNT